MRKTVFVFGALVLAILVLFQLSKYNVAMGHLNSEWVIAVMAILFFLVGLLINRQQRLKNISQTSENIIDEEKIAALGISKREYEILELIAKGLSNREIGEQLHISENTIKTHVSNLFTKLDVKRRTQAIRQAKLLRIIN